MLITLEPAFALQLQLYILIEETCSIILLSNTMLLKSLVEIQLQRKLR